MGIRVHVKKRVPRGCPHEGGLCCLELLWQEGRTFLIPEGAVSWAIQEANPDGTFPLQTC